MQTAWNEAIKKAMVNKNIWQHKHLAIQTFGHIHVLPSSMCKFEIVKWTWALMCTSRRNWSQILGFTMACYMLNIESNSFIYFLLERAMAFTYYHRHLNWFNLAHSIGMFGGRVVSLAKYLCSIEDSRGAHLWLWLNEFLFLAYSQRMFERRKKSIAKCLCWIWKRLEGTCGHGWMVLFIFGLYPINAWWKNHECCKMIVLDKNECSIFSMTMAVSWVLMVLLYLVD